MYIALKSLPRGKNTLKTQEINIVLEGKKKPTINGRLKRVLRYEKNN